jgi:hypothetical protein
MICPPLAAPHEGITSPHKKVVPLLAGHETMRSSCSVKGRSREASRGGAGCGACRCGVASTSSGGPDPASRPHAPEKCEALFGQAHAMKGEIESRRPLHQLHQRCVRLSIGDRRPITACQMRARCRGYGLAAGSTDTASQGRQCPVGGKSRGPAVAAQAAMSGAGRLSRPAGRPYFLECGKGVPKPPRRAFGRTPLSAGHATGTRSFERPPPLRFGEGALRRRP